MARILYGIHGTGHGHAMRGLTIARGLTEHEFLFVSDGDAPSVLEKEFPVARLEGLGTVCRDYRVDLPATVAQAASVLLRRKNITEKLLRIMDDFKPDRCMTDLEYFVPRAAKRSGLAIFSATRTARSARPIWSSAPSPIRHAGGHVRSAVGTAGGI